MAHIGASDDDWANAKIGSNPKVDLFECKCCDLEFSLASVKIRGKQIFCPVCQHGLLPWQKDWIHY